MENCLNAKYGSKLRRKRYLAKSKTDAVSS